MGGKKEKKRKKMEIVHKRFVTIFYASPPSPEV
jgi:hypothetical protein